MMTLSKLKGYFELAGKGIVNFKSVLSGIVTDVRLSHGSLPAEIQEEIIRRRVICNACPFNSKNALKSKEFEFINGGIPYKNPTGRADLHCSICSCNVDYKTASMAENCGLTYYNALNPNNEQPLKWEAYKN